RFADVGPRREMDDRVDALFQQQLIDAMRLIEIADHEPLGRNGLAMAVDEIIVDPEVVDPFEEQANRVRADVAGPAGNQDLHKQSSSSSPLRTSAALPLACIAD